MSSATQLHAWLAALLYVARLTNFIQVAQASRAGSWARPHWSAPDWVIYKFRKWRSGFSVAAEPVCDTRPSKAQQLLEVLTDLRLPCVDNLEIIRLKPMYVICLLNLRIGCASWALGRRTHSWLRRSVVVAYTQQLSNSSICPMLTLFAQVLCSSAQVWLLLLLLRLFW